MGVAAAAAGRVATHEGDVAQVRPDRGQGAPQTLTVSEPLVARPALRLPARPRGAPHVQRRPTVRGLLRPRRPRAGGDHRHRRLCFLSPGGWALRGGLLRQAILRVRVSRGGPRQPQPLRSGRRQELRGRYGALLVRRGVRGPLPSHTGVGGPRLQGILRPLQRQDQPRPALLAQLRPDRNPLLRQARHDTQRCRPAHPRRLLAGGDLLRLLARRRQCARTRLLLLHRAGARRSRGAAPEPGRRVLAGRHRAAYVRGGAQEG